MIIWDYFYYQKPKEPPAPPPSGGVEAVEVADEEEADFDRLADAFIAEVAERAFGDDDSEGDE